VVLGAGSAAIGSLTAGAAIIGKVGIDQTTPGTTNGIQVNAALPAGTNLMGKVGIDQTTVGTTNGVAVTQIGTATILAGTGAVGTGSQRIAVGTDSATLAGSAPSTVLQTNDTQWGGTAITNVPTAVGTAGTGNTPTVNAYIVGGGAAGGTSSTFGSAFPTTGTAIGLTSGTNMVAWSATSNYGTAPSAIPVPAVNAAVTQTTAANLNATVVGAGGGTLMTQTGGTVGLVAGATIVGKVGIDQTTVGTTNGVSLAQVGATTVSTGTGAVGTGSQRVAVGTDVATIAGSAPSVVLQHNNAQWGGTGITNVPTAVGTAGTGLTPTINAYIVGGAGSGGTAGADGAAWAVHTTPQTPIGCQFTSGGATVLATATMGTVGCTPARGLFTDLSSEAGTAITSVPSAYGTAPTGNVIGANVFVTNTNGNGSAVSASSSPVVIASDQSAVPVSPTPYPATAVPITASATGTTAATTATLTNVAGHKTYICGFSIRANATAAATGNATVTGTVTATMNWTQWTAPAASGLGVTEEIFSPCIPASAVSTSIAVVSAAPGTGGVVSVSAWGYSL
jgi:hypothetical protein